MSTLEVDQTGEVGTVRAATRQTLIDFMAHLKSQSILKFSYPMPDQERQEGWMLFLYVRIPESVIDSFEA